jgi:hypothetical protein
MKSLAREKDLVLQRFSASMGRNEGSLWLDRKGQIMTQESGRLPGRRNAKWVVAHDDGMTVQTDCRMSQRYHLNSASGSGREEGRVRDGG